MVREIALFLFASFGSFLMGRYGLFNFRSVALTKIHEEAVTSSEKRHAALGAVFVSIPFVLISMLFGVSFFFVKISVLVLFFLAGLLLAIHSDLRLYEKSISLYEQRELSRMREEFFFWLSLLFLIFVLSIFVFV